MRAQWRLLLLTAVMVTALSFSMQVRELLPIYILAGLAGFGVLCFVVSKRVTRSHARLLFVCVSVLCLIVSYSQWRAQQRLAKAIPKDWIGQTFNVTGIIDSIPLRTPFGVRFVFKPSAKQSDIAVRKLVGQGTLPSQISTAWYEDDLQGAGDLKVGQVWRLPITMKPPHATQNPGVFDQEQDWFARDIRGLATVRVNQKTITDSRPKLMGVESSLWAFTQNIRAAALRRIDEQSTGDNDEANALLKALAFGDQSAISSAQWALFQETGVTHLVSVSGFHITMLAGLAAWLTQFLWRRSERLCIMMPSLYVAQWIGLAVALSYAVLAGWALPAQRTVMMMVLWLVLSRLGVASSGVRVLCLALWLVLMWDPFAVLSVSFWLSFGAVAWLILAFDRAENAEFESVTPNRWTIVMAFLSSQLAIGLALIPLSLYFFHQASLLGVLVNFVAIPFISIVVTPLVLLMSVLEFCFGWTWPLAIAHTVLAQCGLALQAVVQLVPYGMLVHTLSWLQVFMAAGFSIALMVFLQKRNWLVSAIFALVVGITLSFGPTQAAIENGQVRVHFIDIGQGNAVLLQTAQHNWLYDTGPKYGSDTDAGARVVVPYLRDIGVESLDTLILSHNDSDHTGGASSISRVFPVKQVLTSIAFDRMGELNLKADAINHCTEGQSWVVDGVELSILSPNEATLHNAQLADNPKSCVLKVQTPSGEMHSLMLVGDIDALQEARLVVSPTGGVRDWHTDVLLMPHHGSAGSSSAPFIESTSPKWVVAQAGYLNSFHHPHPLIVSRYQTAGVQVFNSVQTGALQFCLGCQSADATAWREIGRKYWWD